MRYIFLFITLVSSCMQNDKNYDCEDLSMKYYRGLPKESHLYVKHCKKKEKELKYSPEICKQALGTLMMSGSLKLVEEKFGKRAKGCFNKVDLERFAK